MTKFIKTLIIINGLIVPVLLLIILIIFINNYLITSPDRYVPDSLKTENLITKDGDTLMTQGLQYSDPEPVYNSTNFMIKVSPKTYKKPKKVDPSIPNDASPVLFAMMEGPNPDGYNVNILFLDKNYDVIGKLVNKKASIESVTIPNVSRYEKVDTSVKNIGYLIAFEDSNNDKLIDWNDNNDLYISNLSGNNLTQVTKGIDIKDFSFINNHSDLFISYTDRTDIRNEYKVTRFAIFNIKTGELRKLNSIDKELNSIQRILK